MRLHQRIVIPTPLEPAVLVTANHAVVYGIVARWLLHDLRNPTQALSLVSELVPGPGAELDSDLWVTLSDATRQLGVCVDLLDRSLRTVSPAAGPGPVVLSQSFDFLAQLYATRKSPVRFDIAQIVDQPLPPVYANEDHFEHVLLNLLMNAFEAMGDREEGRIVVTGEAKDGHLELTFDDDGPGCVPEVRECLFEPYVTTKPPSGRAVGLGLPVARYLLGLSGGTIDYESKPTPGARFVLSVPTWPPARRD